jgi:hypothetical protein
MSEPKASRPEGPSARSWRGADTQSVILVEQLEEAP